MVGASGGWVHDREAGSSRRPVDSETTREAWQRYVETGLVTPDLLRDHVRRAWERCHALGASPLHMEARKLSPEATADLLHAERQLLGAARPYLRALSQAAGVERHAAMVSDADGRVLDVVGDDETVHHTPGFPGPGSLLSEETAGSNGIGTPLAENAYVDILGPEHFIQGFHVYTCQGLPLRGPAGVVAGALSISVRRIQVAERLREILVCAAHGVEAELTRFRLEQEVEQVLREGPAGGAKLEDLRQDILQLQAAARLRIDRAARALRSEQPENAFAVLLLADDLIKRFRRQAALWREIAFEENAMAEPVDLQERLFEVVSLLRTESSVRGVQTSVRAGPRVRVLSDSRQLTRLLFRWSWSALESAGRGAVLEAAVHADRGSGLATCSLSGSTSTLSFPLISGDST